MTRPSYDRLIRSDGMTVDTVRGPADIVALDRVRAGFRTELTGADSVHLDTLLLDYDASAEQLLAEGLGVRVESVNRRISRNRKRAAAEAAAP